MPAPDGRRAARLADVIAADFYSGRLDLSARGVRPPEGTWDGMPEVWAVARLRESGADDREVRLFLTFIAAMDRIRNANVLWRNGVRLLREYPETFEPAEVREIAVPTLRLRLMSFGVSKLHVPDSRAWHAIARSLARDESPVVSVVESGVGEAGELLSDLPSRSKGVSRFPSLRGPKIGPMWVRMLAAPGGATIANLDTIPVAVDVHVRRVTENLGVCSTPGTEMDRAGPWIQNAWRDAVASAKIAGPPGIAGTCAALDPALWAFGKYGCGHCETVRRRVPVSRACDGCQLQVRS